MLKDLNLLNGTLKKYFLKKIGRYWWNEAQWFPWESIPWEWTSLECKRLRALVCDINKFCAHCDGGMSTKKSSVSWVSLESLSWLGIWGGGFCIQSWWPTRCGTKLLRFFEGHFPKNRHVLTGSDHSCESTGMFAHTHIGIHTQTHTLTNTHRHRPSHTLSQPPNPMTQL